MSRHHVAAKWSTDSRKFRAILEPQLPLPCVNPCKHGGIVYPGQKWQVAHRPGHDQRNGRRATIKDVGAAHTDCNLIDGGRAGAAITNASRRAAREHAQDIRPW